MVGKILGEVVIAPSTEIGSSKDCWKEVIVEGALLVWVSALRESLNRALTLQVELEVFVPHALSGDSIAAL